MRIVHVVEPFASGIIQQIASIVNGTPSYSVVVHGSRMWVDEEENVKKLFKSGTEFLLWKHANRPIHLINDSSAFFELVRLLKPYKSDIIHLHSAKAGFLGRLACKYLGIKKVIYTPHGAPFARRDISALTKNLYVKLERFGHWLYSSGTVSCSRSEHDLYESFGMGSQTIPNGVSLNVDGVEKKKVDASNFIIGFSGIVKAQKAPDFFNDVARSFESDKHVQFLWIGDGQQRDLLTATNIKLTGWVKPDEVLDKLNQIDVYFSTAQWEGLSLSALEAMALSKPLVLRNSVGNTDVVDPGKNGFLFDSVDQATEQLRRLKSDKKMVQRFGAESRRIFEREFDVSFMVSQYHNLYEQL